MLGLLEQGEPATPYDLKQLAQLSTSNFWTVPHTQLYTECARLAEEGLLDEQPGADGPAPAHLPADRRAGARRSTAGASEPASDLYELRDAATLKLFFGADPATLAAAQLEAHKRPAGGVRASCTRASTATARRPAAGARVRHRPRARVHPLLVARRPRRRARAEPSAEHVLVAAGAAARAAPGPSSSVTKRSSPSIDDDRLARVLARARSASGGGGVGDGQPGRAQLACPRRRCARASRRAAHPGEPDRDVELPVAPGASEAVGDQHADARAGQLAQARAQSRARRRRGRAAAGSACRRRRRWRRRRRRWRRRSRGGCGRSARRARRAATSADSSSTTCTARGSLPVRSAAQLARARAAARRRRARRPRPRPWTRPCARSRRRCPSRSGAPSRARRAAISAREVVAGAQLGQAREGAGAEDRHASLAQAAR